MIALNTHRAPLTALKPGQMFVFAASSESGTPLVLSSWRSGAVIGHGPNRAADGQLNPEQTHLVVFGKALVLDGLALSELRRAPA